MTKHNLETHLAWLLKRPNPLDDEQFLNLQAASTESSNPVARANTITNTESISPQRTRRVSIPPRPEVEAPGDGVRLPASDNMPQLQLASPSASRIQMRSLMKPEEFADVPGTPCNRKGNQRTSKIEPSVSRSKTPKTKC